MQRSRGLVIGIIAAVVVAVVIISIIAIRTTYPDSTASAPTSGASSPTSSTQAAAPPMPSPSPTVDPVIAWADSVCGASFDIRDTITAVGEDLAVTPGPGAIDEIRSRLRQRADVIAGQLEPLAVAVGQVPIDVPEAMALADELNGEITALQAAADSTRAAIDGLTQADGVVAFGLALPDAISAAGQAKDAVGAVAETVKGTVQDQGGRLGPGFQQSATCQALTSGAARPTS